MNERFLKRLWLIEHLPLLLREIPYHRLVEEDEKLPAQVWWRSVD